MGWHATNIQILHLCALPYSVCLSTAGLGLGNVIGSCTSVVSYFTMFADASGFRPSPHFYPLHNVRQDLRTYHLGNNQFHSDTLWWFSTNVNLFYFFSNGKTEQHRSGLSPDRHKNTNKINLCQFHLELG